MNKTLSYKKNTIRFRQWSRDAYAVFASLGKEVNIGHVDMDICDRASEKNDQTKSLSNAKSECLLDESKDQEEFPEVKTEHQLHLLLAITESNESSSQHCCVLLTNIYYQFYLHPVSRMQSSINLF